MTNLENRFHTDRDRDYAASLLDDLDIKAVGPQLEIVTQWMCKVRVETARAAARPALPTREETIEECAKFVEQHQETIRETSNGSERYLASRKVGNLMGMAYVDGLRALTGKTGK